MELSVCILTWNAREYLEEALATLAPVVASGFCEVIVIDNNSTDGTSGYLTQEHPDIRLITNKSNRGFAAGNNQGLEVAKGRYLMILNPDTLVHPEAFETLVAYMDSHPKVGIAGPKLLNRDGSLQFSCRRFPKPLAAAFRNTPLGRLFPNSHLVRDYLMQDMPHDADGAVDWLSGAAMIFRRDVYELLGGLSEDYFMYLEDVDFCLRAHQAGWEVHYVPEAVITHVIGGSSSKNPLPMVIVFHKSMYRYFVKHQSPGWKALLRPLAASALAARGFTVAVKVCFDLLKDRLRGKA